MLHVPYSTLPLEQEDVLYAYGPHSTPQRDVTAGRRIELRIDDPSEFPGTTRSVWIHVPDGIQADGAATVILDGSWYLDPDGAFRADTVLDNLVAAELIPPMIGVFVDPGEFLDADAAERKNRNAEYDDPGSTFGDFLSDRVLPLVREHVAVSTDPSRVLICGGSSGGNAAFTAAWHRPEAFGRVASLGGSFAQMPGGNPYPHLIASTPRKNLRVLLTASHRDLGWNAADGNWLAENLLNAAALAKAGYDFRLVLREGGHSMVNGGALLPDALRWIWSDGTSQPR